MSSPGLDRILKIPGDLERNAGKWVCVKLLEAESGQKVVRGRIGTVTGEGFGLLMETGKKSSTIQIRFSNVRSVQAEFWKPVPLRSAQGANLS